MISAFEKSVELLACAELSSKDLCTKLRKRGYEEAKIRETIERLYAAGYLDDARYARAFIRKNMRGKSTRRIRQELNQKSIRLTDPEQFVSEVYLEEGCTEEETLQRLVERRLRGNREPDEKELRRLYAYLLRRGFSYHAIKDAIPSPGMEVV